MKKEVIFLSKYTCLFFLIDAVVDSVMGQTMVSDSV